MNILQLEHRLSDYWIQKERHDEECKCQRKAVSCGLFTLDDGHLTTGHNGPDGEHVCGGPEAVGSCGCTHAELNALADWMDAPNYTATKDMMLVCDYSPCTMCATQLLKNLQLKAVFFRDFTAHDPLGYQMLDQAGVILGYTDMLDAIVNMKQRGILYESMPEFHKEMLAFLGGEWNV